MTALAPKTQIRSDTEIVTQVRHWTDRLFSFRLTRPASFRFRSGEFVMIGLPGEAVRPIMRAYSIASPAWDDTLEFYSIKIANGPLTSRLQHIQPGDEVILRPKPVGTLVLDALLPGKRFYMIATGTGIAPFASLLRDPETYERFDEVILTHTCRRMADLQFGTKLVRSLPDDPLIGTQVAGRLTYVPTTTQEESSLMGRITYWIKDGRLAQHLARPALDPALDRVMICGSMALNTDVKALLEERNFKEGAVSAPGDFVLEKAFVG